MNVASILHQYSTLDIPFPLPRLTHALLPKAFRRIKRLVGHQCAVFTTVFDHSSRFIITGSDDHLIKIWSMHSAYLQYTLRGHDSNITEIVRHPTRPLIVSASSDSTLRVWDLTNGAALYVLDGGNREVNALQFSPCPDRPYLVSGGADGSVRLWNTTNFEAASMRIPIPQRVIARHATDTRQAAASTSPPVPAVFNSTAYPNLNSGAPSQSPPHIPASSPTSASIVASATPSITQTTRAHTSSTPLPAGPSTAHTTNGSIAASSVQPLSAPMPLSSSNPSIHMQSTSAPVSGHAVTDGNANSHPQPESNTGRGVATATAASNTASRSQAHGPSNSMVSGTPLYEVLSVSFNAGATRLAIGGSDCNTHLFAVENPKPRIDTDPTDPQFPTIRFLTTLRGHTDAIIQVLFSNSGDRIITAGRDGTAHIWKRMKAQLPVGLKKRADVNGMGTWSPILLDCRVQQNADNRSGFSGAASGSVTGSIIPRTRRIIMPVALCAVMWSRDDRFVLTSSSDAKIRIWDSFNGRLVRVLEGHEQEVYTMQFHPLNENILLTGGYDGKCIFWDISNGQQMRTLFVGDNDEDETDGGAQSQDSLTVKRPLIYDGQFSRDGMSFVMSDSSGAITIFGVDSTESTCIAPQEQFFANEQFPIRRDDQNRVVHETTGRLLHLEPKGLLCDRDYRPHPAELQPLPETTSCTIQESSDDVNSFIPEQIHTQAHRALVERAREFRANQEREESRLYREAKMAKRRAMVEKEKASLERDGESPYHSLKDFTVPDSDVDDSDKDYKADDAMLNSLESSSSSSDDDEDKIRPANVSKSKSVSKRRERSDLLSGAIQKRRRLRRVRGRAKATNLAESSDEDDRKKASGNNGGGNGKKKGLDEESPAYEVDSHESESDDSRSSSDHSLKKLNLKNEERPISTLAKVRATSRSTIDIQKTGISRQTSSEAHAVNMSIAISPTHSQAPLTPSLTLGGASVMKGKPRMKISLSEFRENGPQSISSNPNANSSRNMRRVHNSDGSREQRVETGGGIAAYMHPNSSASILGAVASRNPSNTTEHKKGENSRMKGVHVEDHHDDTASCFGAARSLTDLLREERGGGSLDGVQHQITTDGSHHPDQSTEALGLHQPPLKNGLSDNMHMELDGRDTAEKSVLSDSPGRFSRTRARTTRSGTMKDDTMENGTLPTVDIDEIAEKEVEILDAQRNRKRKRTKTRASADSDGGEHSDNDGDGPVTNLGFGVMDASVELENVIERGKRLRRRPNGKGTASAKGRWIGEGGGQRTLEASAWLRTSNNRFTYVPQVDDVVTYFAEGHIEAISIARGIGLDPLPDKALHKRNGKEALDGTVLGKDCPPVQFQIVEVSYQFPTASQKVKVPGSKGKMVRANPDAIAAQSQTVMVLTLRLVSGMKRKAGQTDLFVLSYFPVDAPDYLVLTTRVKAALNRSWKAKDRFRILFLNENRSWQYYTGSIRNVKPTLHKVMWNTIEVEYDNEGEIDKGNIDFVSPWELEPYELGQGTKDFTTSSVYAVSSSKATVEPGLFPIIAKDLDLIRSTETSWRAKLSWMDTVDMLTTSPGYAETIPCPMDLNIILVRLCTGYYRHFSSFCHDVNLVKSNANRFHGEQSEIGKLTTQVCQRILQSARHTREQLTAIHSSSFRGAIHTNGVHSNSRNAWMRPSAGGDPGPGGFASVSHAGVIGSKSLGLQMGILTGSQSGIVNATQDATAVAQHRVWNGPRIYGGSHNMNHSGGAHGSAAHAQSGVGSLPPLRMASNATSNKAGGFRGARSANQTRNVTHQNNGTFVRNNSSNGKNGMVSHVHTQTNVNVHAHTQGSPTMSVSAAAGGFSMPGGGGGGTTNLTDLEGEMSRMVQHHQHHVLHQHQQQPPVGVSVDQGQTAMMGGLQQHYPLTPGAQTPTVSRNSIHGVDDRSGKGVTVVGLSSKLGSGGGGGTSAGSLQAFGDVAASNFGRAYSGNGVVSPPPDGVGSGGTMSATQANNIGVPGTVNHSMNHAIIGGGSRREDIVMGSRIGRGESAGGIGIGGAGASRGSGNLGIGSSNGGATRSGTGTGGGPRHRSRGLGMGGGSSGGLTGITSGGGGVIGGGAISGGGDGGAHSWSRSMEGAGGMLPLQASTSDSHLVTPHGRSQSPISPVGRADGGVHAGSSARHGGSAMNYHEHSTVSMAAAESTMSCGGVEMALQAASAESIEVATSSRNEGRKVR